MDEGLIFNPNHVYCVLECVSFVFIFLIWSCPISCNFKSLFELWLTTHGTIISFILLKIQFFPWYDWDELSLILIIVLIWALKYIYWEEMVDIYYWSEHWNIYILRINARYFEGVSIVRKSNYNSTSFMNFFVGIYYFVTSYNIRISFISLGVVIYTFWSMEEEIDQTNIVWNIHEH